MKGLYNKLKFDFKFDDKKQRILYTFDPDEENPFFSEKLYGDFPTTAAYDNVGSLIFSIFPEDEDGLKDLPHFLNELKNLQTLSIPVDWLEKIHIPTSLNTLLLTSAVFDKDRYFKWPDDLSIPSLKYLKIPELVGPFAINFRSMPQLTWIELDLQAEEDDKKLAELAKLDHLKHLIFDHAKDFDVFSPFKKHAIESLELCACTGTKFPVENLRNLKSLKYLRINNIAVPFDCQLLFELPNLIELEILNIKHVENMEDLPEHQSLKSLSVLDCNNPFNSIGKEVFENKGYDYLSIDYA